MKKSTILSVLFAISLQITAQNFAPIGSIWHYTQGTLNPDVTSFKTLESVSDTIINGKNCRKLIEVERYLDTIGTSFQYMYSENDSVFFFADDNFHLLYDFSAIKGDTIILEYFSTWNGTPLKMIIDSTSLIMVNDQERKIQFITCGDGVVIEFGNHVIEGIGNTSFMFPTMDGSLNGPLRCYQDTSTGLFLNPFHPAYEWNHEDCEEIITGITEPIWSDDISIFPNPANSTISIRNIYKPATYKIYNLNGEILLSGNVIGLSEINISGLSKGFYFIELKNENVITKRKLIKN
ncbi:MAG: hypothetical protein A2W91_17630 [Bacteroidetes bacterium GWF2_38_335]|nr:MAG: hypothetical protein A2W91_17630 [Bacteroidetes bacterium GWF2_38_335]OFY78045.1 MAG: hypothetical protein A2281_18830 [Bacteroidetes bacterium RIFOXYA12_FULL_38_20]HBS88317.1 hypothetical protein [Bacteroidales bacterium]